MVAFLTPTVAIAPALLCLASTSRLRKEIGQEANALAGGHAGDAATGSLQLLLVSWSPAVEEGSSRNL